VPVIYNSLSSGKKVGILTASSKLITRWDNMLLRECGVDKSIPIVISGMSESDYCETWWSQLNQGFNKKKVEEAIVEVALKMISDEPNIRAIVCECTEMPPYSEAIRNATDLPVFDAVDMVNYVYSLVKNR
jgi:Asp/Glu/hydantoin racemase